MTRIKDYTLFSRYRLGSVMSKPILTFAKVFVELFSKSSPPEARSPCKHNRPTNCNLFNFSALEVVAFILGVAHREGLARQCAVADDRLKQLIFGHTVEKEADGVRS